jgi:hypothetical protein
VGKANNDLYLGDLLRKLPKMTNGHPILFHGAKPPKNYKKSDHTGQRLQLLSNFSTLKMGKGGFGERGGRGGGRGGFRGGTKRCFFASCQKITHVF